MIFGAKHALCPGFSTLDCIIKLQWINLHVIRAIAQNELYKSLIHVGCVWTLVPGTVINPDKNDGGEDMPVRRIRAMTFTAADAAIHKLW